MIRVALALVVIIMLCGSPVLAKDYSEIAGNWQVSFKSNDTLYLNSVWNEPTKDNDVGYYTVWAKEDPGETTRSSAIELFEYDTPIPFTGESLRGWMRLFLKYFNETPIISDYAIDGKKAVLASGWDPNFGRTVWGAMYSIDIDEYGSGKRVVGILSLLDESVTREIVDSLHVQYRSSKSSTPTSVAKEASFSALGTRENPVPMGTSVNLGDGWVVTVLSVTPDATPIILQENQFNNRPESGNQFFLARVRADYEGEGSDTFDGGYRLRAVGPSGVGYSTFENSAGVIPDELAGSEVFSGGHIDGNIAWQIKSDDAGSLVMYDSKTSKNGRLYMALFGGETRQSSSLSSSRAWEYQGAGKMGRY